MEQNVFVQTDFHQEKWIYVHKGSTKEVSASIVSLFSFLLIFTSSGRSCADINQQKLLRDKWKIWLVVGISVMILSPYQGSRA